MKVVFEGDHNERAKNAPPSRVSVSLYGLTFPHGEAVDVSALKPDQQKKLSGHPDFAVVEEKHAEEQPAEPVADCGAERATTPRTSRKRAGG